MAIEIGVIGGSGFYAMKGLSDIEHRRINTPYGPPSDKFVIGTLDGVRVAFLARHGEGHRVLPGELNTKANIWGFKSLGVKWLISVSACGSLKEDFAPGHIVIPDGLFDRTTGRDGTFFGGGVVAHTSLAEPFCPVLRENLLKACQDTEGAKVHEGGALVVINGPRFSTKTESNIFRSWGLELINMTTCPEAQLAREAEIAYAVINHVTDYDCWHESEEAVTVEAVIKVLMANVEVAQNSLRKAIQSVAKESRESLAWSALKDAIMTKEELVPKDVRRDLSFIVDKYWGPLDK